MAWRRRPRYLLRAAACRCRAIHVDASPENAKRRIRGYSRFSPVARLTIVTPLCTGPALAAQPLRLASRRIGRERDPLRVFREIERRRCSAAGVTAAAGAGSRRRDLTDFEGKLLLAGFRTLHDDLRITFARRDAIGKPLAVVRDRGRANRLPADDVLQLDRTALRALTASWRWVRPRAAVTARPQAQASGPTSAVSISSICLLVSGRAGPEEGDIVAQIARRQVIGAADGAKTKSSAQPMALKNDHSCKSNRDPPIWRQMTHLAAERSAYAVAAVVGAATWLVGFDDRWAAGGVGLRALFLRGTAGHRRARCVARFSLSAPGVAMGLRAVRRASTGRPGAESDGRVASPWPHRLWLLRRGVPDSSLCRREAGECDGEEVNDNPCVAQ